MSESGEGVVGIVGPNLIKEGKKIDNVAEHLAGK